MGGADPGQGVDVDLHVEVAGIGEDGAVLHDLEMLFPEDVDVAGEGAEDVADLGGLGHGQDFVAVHEGLQALQGIDLGDDDPGAHAPGPHGQTAAAPAVARHHEDVAGHQAVGGPQDAVQGALAGAVAVVEEILGHGVVDRDDGVFQHPVLGHGLEADDAGGGLLGAGEDPREQLLALGMHGKDDIGAVVHGHLGFDVQGLVEVAVVGVAVFALDGEGGDAFMLGQVGGHVVLGAQGIGGADVHRGPAGLQGGRQHSRSRW